MRFRSTQYHALHVHFDTPFGQRSARFEHGELNTDDLDPAIREYAEAHLTAYAERDEHVHVVAE